MGKTLRRDQESGKIRCSLTPGFEAYTIPRLMRRVDVPVLCAAFLVGMLATSVVHTHPATEHQHGAQDRHDHESLLHAHLRGCGDSTPGPHAADGDHGPHEATAIYSSCCSVTLKAPNVAPGMPTVIVGACDDPALGSSLELANASHPRPPLYLIGPSLRGPPSA